MSTDLHCPLCCHSGTDDFYRDKRREYRRYLRCGLVFVPPQFYLTAEQEKAEYDLHCNAVDDPGYRGFLSRLAKPMMDRLAPASRGLDFGCGPGPALAAMFAEAGHQVSLYDVFYQPDTDPLRRRYQFITATEVVEHLHRPGEVLAGLWHQLGMTPRYPPGSSCCQRPAHVCFFSERTWRWWAGENGARLERFGADVILLQRN